MKYLLLILIFLSCKCFGQTDTLPQTDTLGTDLQGPTSTTIDTTWISYRQLASDTVKVIMVGVDTARYRLLWTYGYRCVDSALIGYWYLNQNKKLLNKSFIVITAKPLEWK